MPCSNTYDFSFVPPNYSVHFASPVTKGEYPAKTNCGWWFFVSVPAESYVYILLNKLNQLQQMLNNLQKFTPEVDEIVLII